MDSYDRIKHQLATHPLVLFMRGSPDRPMCQGSADAVAALAEAGADYHHVDIQKDPEIRAYLPKFADMPGFPLLFIQGELIGGSEIICELVQQGELQAMVEGLQQMHAIAS